VHRCKYVFAGALPGGFCCWLTPCSLLAESSNVCGRHGLQQLQVTEALITGHHTLLDVAEVAVGRMEVGAIIGGNGAWQSGGEGDALLEGLCCGTLADRGSGTCQGPPPHLLWEGGVGWDRGHGGEGVHPVPPGVGDEPELLHVVLLKGLISQPVGTLQVDGPHLVAVQAQSQELRDAGASTGARQHNVGGIIRLFLDEVLEALGNIGLVQLIHETVDLHVALW